MYVLYMGLYMIYIILYLRHVLIDDEHHILEQKTEGAIIFENFGRTGAVDQTAAMFLKRHLNASLKRKAM